MAKNPIELQWIEDLLPDDFRRRPMFGGFAYYMGEKMILATFESLGSRTYKGETFDFELWNGCMLPVEKEFQDKARHRFPLLKTHPILPKWLYLPLDTEGFDEHISDIISQVIRPTSFWGVVPKSKSKTAKKAPKEDKISLKIDTRRPRMFSDEPAEEKLKNVKKISDFKNLGATSEQHFQKAGIKTPQQFIKMGWKKAMEKLVASNPKTRHTIYAYALIGALTNKDAFHITEEEKAEARLFTKSLAPKKEPKKKVTKKTVAKKKASKKKKK